MVPREKEDCSYWTQRERESDSAGSHWWTGTEEAGSSGMAVAVVVVEEEEAEEEGLGQCAWGLAWIAGSAVVLWVSGS